MYIDFRQGKNKWIKSLIKKITSGSLHSPGLQDPQKARLLEQHYCATLFELLKRLDLFSPLSHLILSLCLVLAFQRICVSEFLPHFQYFLSKKERESYLYMLCEEKVVDFAISHVSAPFKSQKHRGKPEQFFSCPFYHLLQSREHREGHALHRVN